MIDEFCKVNLKIIKIVQSFEITNNIVTTIILGSKKKRNFMFTSKKMILVELIVV